MSVLNKKRCKTNGHYCHIQSIFNFSDTIDENILTDYNSKINPLSKDSLRDYLYRLKLL